MRLAHFLWGIVLVALGLVIATALYARSGGLGGGGAFGLLLAATVRLLAIALGAIGDVINYFRTLIPGGGP